MGPRPDLSPFPNGWFVFGLSEELKPGSVLSRTFLGQEVTVFRTRSGQAYAVDSYCPHLGAHFGHGATVHGDVLQCPFHGFQFNGEGACIRTGYDSPVPPKAKLRTWHLREVDGFLAIYHHLNHEAPAWEVPISVTEGWTPLILRSFILHDHPQETTENSVDVGHFAYVHGYRSPRTMTEFDAHGEHLTTAFAARRALRMFGFEITDYEFQFETQIYGLGYSTVNIRVPIFRVIARLWVLPTPIDADRLTLRLALRMKKWDSLPGALLSPIVARAILNGFVHDASQDFPIWEHKRYTANPALAKGDGPIGKYRQWAKQFYH